MVISEKIIRRIMRAEGLIVKIKKTAKYNSYAGEITPAVPNKLKGDFTATKPNAKWLTDITEFAIPSGKVYLSPIVDCFDGLLVTWNIKNEMFYNTDWSGVSLLKFIDILNNYLI